MDTMIHKVRDLEGTERAALEHLLGQKLLEHEQLVIHVVRVDASKRPMDQDIEISTDAPPWLGIFDGLNSAEVTRLERVLHTRADLSRFHPKA